MWLHLGQQWLYAMGVRWGMAVCNGGELGHGWDLIVNSSMQSNYRNTLFRLSSLPVPTYLCHVRVAPLILQRNVQLCFCLHYLFPLLLYPSICRVPRREVTLMPGPAESKHLQSRLIPSRVNTGLTAHRYSIKCHLACMQAMECDFRE